MRIKNDRLVGRKNRKDSKGNIPLDLESKNISKILQKEKINGICFNYYYVCFY